MTLKDLEEYSIERLRDVYRETIQYGISLEKELNKNIPGMTWGVAVEWDETNIYLMISPLMNVPEAVEFTAYISINILPRLKIDCVIGVSRDNIEFMRENKNLLIDENIIKYYDIMYKLLDYMKGVVA